MSPPQACLVDVYETILTCDFGRLRNELPALAGVPERAWHRELTARGPALSNGRLSTAAAFAEILQALDATPRPGLVERLVRRDRELLRASARLFDDAIWFLESLRHRNIKIAIVSNCRDNTRSLLTELGVAALADVLVLSCEAGYAKPAPQVYRQALDQLGVAAETSVFVDDQVPYCAGAAAAGITAIQITRPGSPAPGPAVSPASPGPHDGQLTRVASLREAAALIWSPGPLS